MLDVVLWGKYEIFVGLSKMVFLIEWVWYMLYVFVYGLKEMVFVIFVLI